MRHSLARRPPAHVTSSVYVTEQQSRERKPLPMERRELAAQGLMASLFLLAAGSLVAFGLRGEVSLSDLLLLVLGAAILGRLEFETGAGYTVPTQLVFVPMLFVLPPAIVPLAVAAALALDRIPDLVRGRRHPQRLVMALGDAWYSVGPAFVFVVAGLDGPQLSDWPLYVLALGAQFAGDYLSGALRERLAHGLSTVPPLKVMGEVWFVDVLLSAGGLLAALATVVQPYAYLLALPPAALLAVLSRERRERIGSAIELSTAYRGTAMLLGDVLSDDDEYTGLHSHGVVDFARQIADELALDQEQRRLVELGAMLHDIGKLETPKEILNKPGPLADDEWTIMHTHTIVGQRMLDRIGGGLRDVGRVVRSSHERVDGKGYPDGLSGEQIPLAARIVAVADAYSAMTTSRPYRHALPRRFAQNELRKHAGTQFDTAVVVAALRLLGQLAPEAEPPHHAADKPALGPRG
jgi:putative nucleotidyltransferase with HDIG domain